jgi:hypothetical protein
MLKVLLRGQPKKNLRVWLENKCFHQSELKLYCGTFFYLITYVKYIQSNFVITNSMGPAKYVHHNRLRYNRVIVFANNLIKIYN